MLARGTSPILVLPFLLFIICFISYFLVASHWLVIVLALIFTILAIMGLVFFRDPDREIGKGLVSAADGVVSFVKEEPKKKVTISVFMNVHNVHVNRTPIAGKVRRTKYSKGPHAPAYKPIANKNEQLVTDLDTDIGPVRVVQIAGTVARRIVPYIKKGDRLYKGQKIGIIKLGSRVDIVLPSDMVKVKVEKGEKVLAGETTVAVLSKKGRAREGE